MFLESQGEKSKEEEKTEIYLDPKLTCPKCGSIDISYYLYPGHGRECRTCQHEWFIGPRNKMVSKRCVVCDTMFETTDGWQKYCSELCEAKRFIEEI